MSVFTSSTRDVDSLFRAHVENAFQTAKHVSTMPCSQVEQKAMFIEPPYLAAPILPLSTALHMILLTHILYHL